MDDVGSLSLTKPCKLHSETTDTIGAHQIYEERSAISSRLGPSSPCRSFTLNVGWPKWFWAIRRSSTEAAAIIEAIYGALVAYSTPLKVRR